MNESLLQLLSRVYPDFQFNKDLAPSSIWTDEHLAKCFVEYLKKQPDIEVFYVHKVFKSMKNKEHSILPLLLKQSFPQYTWTSIRGKKSQYMLKECLENIFKNTEVFEEFRHPDSILELDYYFPDHKIAFEYQV